MEISIDFETRSTVDLRKTGVYPYAAHPDTEVLCMAWAVGDMEPMLWLPGDPVPEDFLYADTFRAWNAQFERIIMREVLGRIDYGFPFDAYDEQWVCTQAEAAAMALPLSLGKAAQVLRVLDQKDEAGHRLMLQMCKPRKARKDESPNLGPYWFEDEARKNRLYKYCLQDVRTEVAVAKKLRRLSKHEREIFLLDQRINDRGIGLDMPLIEAAQEVRAVAVGRADARLQYLSAGAIRGVTDTKGLRTWTKMDSVAEAAVKEKLLDPTLHALEREALELRRDNGKSSVAKLDTMQLVALEGSAHGLLQYSGAGTGRWAGRLIQPQNMPRPAFKNIEELIGLVQERRARELEEHGPIMEILSSLLRSMFVPHAGRLFYCADFSAIEGWVVAWLAGQDGMTSYEEMASEIYGVPVDEVTEEQRAVGKVAVLGCGFGMGAKKYGDTVFDWTGIRISEELEEKAVAIYRSVNAPIKRLWYDLENAAIRAVKVPGSIQKVGHITYRVKGPYLWAVLPSGRPLCYPLPRLVDTLAPWGELKEAVEISTTNSFTRKWERRSLYGGLQTENVVQAVARDVMADAMLRVEAAGYPIVLTVHDEVLAESDAGDLDHFQQLMSEMPEWADGLKLDVSGWEGDRYRK